MRGEQRSVSTTLSKKGQTMQKEKTEVHNVSVRLFVDHSDCCIHALDKSEAESVRRELQSMIDNLEKLYQLGSE